MPTSSTRSTPWWRRWRDWASSIDTSADFRRLLESPLIDVNQATRAALAVLEQEGFGKQVRDFVGVIAANRRLRNLRDIVTRLRRPGGASGAASSPRMSPPPIR